MERSERREPGSMEAAVVKGFIAGSVIGSVLVFVLWGGVALLGGLDLGGAGAVSVFTTFWGGPGFGGMLGAVMGYVRFEERAAPERPRVRVVDEAGAVDGTDEREAA